MWKYFYLLAGCSLALGQSELPCQVTQTPDGTLYSVPNVSASGCIYNWSAGTVVSTNKAKDEKVVIGSSNNTLLTKSCHENVTYSRSCTSEGERMTATCITSCPAALQTNPPSSSTHPHQDSSPETDGTRRSYFGLLMTVVFLLLIAAVAALVFKYLQGKMQRDESEMLPR